MLWIFAGLASAQTFTIGPGLSYDTVEEAIASSSVPDGATLVLPAGDLEVAIVMDGARRLVIQGAGSTLTTLHGTGGGAAVALDGNADLTLTDVHVLGSENDASIRTPPDANVSLTIEDAIVDGGNIATGGGAVLISDGDLVLRRVTFDTPFVPAVPQAVYVKAVGSVVLMEDVEFSGAASTEYAAVSLYEAVSTLRRVDFHDNTTEGVAAALIITDGETTVEDSTFSGNTSATSAGAVRTELNARVTFIDTTFDGNTAANLGGGMYASSSSVSLEGCTFTGNEAVAGAAVLSNATILDVLETSFSGNVAENQGAVALLATSVGTFDHVDFEQNASDISVGALHVETDSEAVVTSSRFIGNTAAFVSAVAVLRASVELRGNRFCGNNGNLGAVKVGNPDEAGSLVMVGNVLDDNTGETASTVHVANGYLDAQYNTFVGGRQGPMLLVGDDAVAKDNLFATSTEAAVAFVEGTDPGVLVRAYNAFWQIPVPDPATTGEVVLTEDPLVGWATETACDGPVVERLDSPLIDAGDPAIPDPDGSASDIGAYGGRGRAYWDVDGDGENGDVDCYDRDPELTGPCVPTVLPTPPPPDEVAVAVPYGRVCGSAPAHTSVFGVLARR